MFAVVSVVHGIVRDYYQNNCFLILLSIEIVLFPIPYLLFRQNMHIFHVP